MSGKPWTRDRRTTQSRRMRRRMRKPQQREKQRVSMTARMQSTAQRLASSMRMKVLNARMRADEKLKAKCIRGQKRVRRSPGYRAMQSLVMKDVMARPEMRRTARFHCIKINKNPRVRKRQWAGRRRRAATRAASTSNPAGKPPAHQGARPHDLAT
jgi:hypothetical protein